MSYIRINNRSEVNSKRLSPHFMAKEFSCSHCGRVLLNEDLLSRLETFRSRIGNMPIKITSAYRCLEHNRSIGSADSSLHVKGDAVDFTTFGRLNGSEVLLKAKDIFNRVGFYQSKYSKKSSYMHVDVGNPRLYWLSYYDDQQRKRVYIYFQSIDHMLTAMKKDTNRDWFSMVI